MAKEQVVIFAPGPNQMEPNHTRMVMDQIVDHLGLEVVHIAGKHYQIRDKNANKSATANAGRKGTAKKAR